MLFYDERQALIEEVRVSYTFDILGVSPPLDFFNQQQQLADRDRSLDVEYLGSHQCTLDGFIQSVETVSYSREWNLDEAVDSVVNFWINNPDSIWYWKERLEDAGRENLLIARVADVKSLRETFESIFRQNG